MRERLINRISVLKDVKRDKENKKDEIILLANDKIISKAFLHDNTRANCDVAMKTDYLIENVKFFF